jgi:hypothetical protein
MVAGPSKKRDSNVTHSTDGLGGNDGFIAGWMRFHRRHRRRIEGGCSAFDAGCFLLQMRGYVFEGASNDGKGRFVGYTSRKVMECPDCKTAVQNFFETGKLEHACTHCQGTMEVCDSH